MHFIHRQRCGNGGVVSLTFDLNGGTYDEDTVDVEVEAIVGVQISEYILDPAPTYADHAFVGWFTDEALTIPYVPTELISGDTTLYAKWNELFDVTYDLNGGNIEASEADVVESDVEAGTLVGSAYDGGTPVRTGYTWTTPYWVTTAGGTTDGASEPVVADVTVYAYWVQD